MWCASLAMGCLAAFAVASRPGTTSPWTWPSVPVHSDVPTVPAMVVAFASAPSPGTGQGTGTGTVALKLNDHRDVLAVTLALCQQGAATSCSSTIEVEWAGHVGRSVAESSLEWRRSSTGRWGVSLNSTLGLYPLLSLPSAGRVVLATGSMGPLSMEDVDSVCRSVGARLVTGGWISRLVRPVPVPRPYPFPPHPYLDLLRHTLVNLVYQDDNVMVVPPFNRLSFSLNDRWYGRSYPGASMPLARLVWCRLWARVAF